MPNILQGMVTKTGAMRKTITVTIGRTFEHPKLLKSMRRTKKLLVHDENEIAREGDRVTIIHGKPFSARKHYALQSIDARRHISGLDKPEAGEGAAPSTETELALANAALNKGGAPVPPAAGAAGMV